MYIIIIYSGNYTSMMMIQYPIVPMQAEHGGCHMPRLVAVSKKQPVEKIVWAYGQGVRHFGENYVRCIVLAIFIGLYGHVLNT